MFDAIDTDGSGAIDKTEILAIAKGISGVLGAEEGIGATPEELQQFVDGVLGEIDGNAVLSYSHCRLCF